MNARHTGRAAFCTLGAGLLASAALVATGCEPGVRTSEASPSTSATSRSAAEAGKQKEVPTVCTGCVTEEKLGKTVAVEARVDQQCPARGCWLRLKDDAGDVMVDLGPNKLELTEDRLGQRAKVTGEVVRKGGRLWLQAAKVEFSAAGKADPVPADKK